jgi:hypothetical protein
MSEVHEEFSLRAQGDSRSSVYAALIDFALRKALALDHKLPDFVLGMEGMSGKKYRSLINTLVSSVPDVRYLEVGTWAGSTVCSAMYGNKAKIKCIDNWSQFGGPRDKFLANVSACRGGDVDFEFIEADFREVDYSRLGKNNIYFFDGPHAHHDQRDGLLMAIPALEDELIFIVDDWNSEEVRAGTIAGLKESGLKFTYCVEKRTTQDGNHPVKAQMQNSDWHNGYFISVLNK